MFFDLEKDIKEKDIILLLLFYTYSVRIQQRNHEFHHKTKFSLKTKRTARTEIGI